MAHVYRLRPDHLEHTYTGLAVQGESIPMSLHHREIDVSEDMCIYHRDEQDKAYHGAIIGGTLYFHGDADNHATVEVLRQVFDGPVLDAVLKYEDKMKEDK